MNLLLAPDSVRAVLAKRFTIAFFKFVGTLRQTFRACCRCERRGREKTLRFNVPTTGAISGAGITTAKRPVTHNTLSAEHRI